MKNSIIVLILFLLIPFTVSAGGQTEESVPMSVDGVVEYFDGEVFVNEVPAEFGMVVPYGAVVKTGSDSYCEVIFENKNIFRIMESTIAEIRLSVENPEITVQKGAFAALFSKLEALTSDEPFKIRTQSMVASVRGTAFFVKVLTENNSYICLCNGELEIAGAGGEQADEYSSGHHTAMYFRNTDGTTKITEAPMLYHSDEDMDQLARHIGEKINWYY